LHPCFSLYRLIICSFFDPAVPITFLRMLPASRIFILVSCSRHSARNLSLYRLSPSLIPSLTSHIRPPDPVPFVGCEKVDADISNISCLRTYGVLGAFAKFRKATFSLVMSVRPSAWNNSAPAGRIFTEYDIYSIFRNSAEKFHVSLKSDKNNVCFA
jgi:hypothetical protein